MTRESIFFIVAHPDDVAFSAGGTAWLLKDRYRLHVLCASRGERGYPEEERRRATAPLPPSPAIAATRALEEQAACRLLGAELTFLDQVDGEIHPDRATCNQVAALIAAERPKAVLTHGPFEKKDHNAVFGIAYQALCLAGRFWETDLCMFLHDNESHNLQMPGILVNIGGVVDRKRDLIRCHRSHLAGEADVEKLLDRNRLLGRMVFAEYAEAFHMPVPLVGQRWGRKAECGQFLLDLGAPVL
jgi:LmbE family N-acetylglucosaminyl deacetylase